MTMAQAAPDRSHQMDANTLTSFLDSLAVTKGSKERREQCPLRYGQPRRAKHPDKAPKMAIKVVYVRRNKKREDVKGKNLTTDDFLIETEYNNDAKMCSLYRACGIHSFLVLHFEMSTPSHIVTLVLKSGFKVKVGKGQERRFVFFGHSASQLRGRTCVLYDEASLGPWEPLINRFGKFELIKNPSKRAARIGLLLSTATKCLEFDDGDISRTEDIEYNGFTFTDGCGFISVASAKQIMDELDISSRYEHQEPPVPSVFQFRMQGCKGIVMVDPSLPKGVCIRPSQEKFEWKLPPPFSFGVCDDGISQPYAFGQLNKQYIMMLSALGVRDEVFLSKQETHFRELDHLETDKEVAFRHLCARGYLGLAERLLSSDNVDSETLEILRGFRNRVRRPPKAQKLHKLLNTKPEPARALKIPIEKSRNVFGVCDPSGKLQPGECFFQATIRETPQILADTMVAVVKCPCYHPGDFRVLKCVNVEECHHLVDCVVFPVTGDRPHPDEIAGSDLDGDKFFVCWDPDLVPDAEEEPLDFPGGEAAKKDKVTQDDLISGFANYNSRTVSLLNDLFNKWADVKGVKSPECRKISKLFATAVDTAKTGKGVTIPPRLRKPPVKKTTAYVWQKMLECANLYLGDMLLTDSDLTVNTFEEADIRELLSNKDINVSEYHLFRFLYKWCERNGRLDHLDTFVRFIDFTRFTSTQKARVVIDCPELSDAYIHNPLTRSKILSASDVERIDVVASNQWSLFYQESDEDISWETVRSALTSETPKLLVFRFDLAGTSLVLGLCLPGPLVMDDVITTEESSTRPTTVFFSDHSGGGIQVVDLQDGFGKDGYLLELDLDHLQIYNVRRLRTFVWLRWSDGAVKMSVALDRFKGQRRDRSIKLQKEEVKFAEIFYQVSSLQSASSIYVERGQRWPLAEEQEKEVETSESKKVEERSLDVDIGSRREFPELGAKPEDVLSEEAERLRILEMVCCAVCREGDAGTLTRASLDPILDLFRILPEAAIPLESIMWKYRDQITLQPSNVQTCFELLIHITSMSSWCCVQPLADAESSSMVMTLERIRRLCQTLRRDGVFFGVDTLRMLFTHLQYSGLKTANTLLDMIRDGTIPISSAGFVSGCQDYYLHWTVLCNMEAQEEVENGRSNALRRTRGGDPSVIRIDKDNGRYIITDWETNEFNLSVGDQVQITPTPNPKEIIVAEVKIDLGEVELNVLWKSNGAQSLTAGQYVVIHVGNRISYVRTMDALDRLCLKGNADNTRKHCGKVCTQIISSFGGNLETNRAEDDSMQDREGTPLDANEEEQAAKTTADASATSAAATAAVAVAAEAATTSAEAATASATTSAEASSAGPNGRDAPTTQDKKRSPEPAGGSGHDYEPQEKPADEKPKGSFTKTLLNCSQDEAVQEATLAQITLIQGPPGTGKTKTAAEIIVQWCLQKDERILAVAETNEGVDNVVQKLLDRKVPKQDILRAGQFEKVRYDLRGLTLDRRYEERHGSDGGRKKSKEIKKIVSKAKIICTTCIGAGSQVLRDITFTRVLVDEAAQVTEPSVLCALSHGCQQVCFIGDDQQLPPLVQCTDAQEMKISLFERLRGQNFHVHLLDTQYRMHPAISDFPSNHFYAGQILNGVTSSDRTPPSGFNWPNRDMPVSFVNVSSRETSRGTSKFNADEADVVIHVAKQLIDGGNVCKDDIGIVSPYKAQIDNIRRELSSCYPNIAVRSVDGFQGQERDVIIFSAVRANEGGYVGFLDDRRRMNVLLTRAKRGLIVVGDGKTLEEGSEDWKTWIQWIRDNKLEQKWTKPEDPKPPQQAETRGGRGGARGRGQRGRGYYGGRGNNGHQ